MKEETLLPFKSLRKYHQHERRAEEIVISFSLLLSDHSQIRYFVLNKILATLSHLEDFFLGIAIIEKSEQN